MSTADAMAIRPVEVRPVEVNDAEAVAALSGELGYPATPELMRSRIAALLGKTDRTVLVAVVDGAVAGWIDVCVAGHLQSGAYAEVGGLVVSSHLRGHGIGQKLLATAEQWAVAQGQETVLVRSQVMREDAHRFYLREGYTRTKTSAVFRKIL